MFKTVGFVQEEPRVGFVLPKTKDLDISLEFQNTERLPSLSTKRTLNPTSRAAKSHRLEKSVDAPMSSMLRQQTRVKLNRSYVLQNQVDVPSSQRVLPNNQFLFGSRFVPETEQCIRDMEGYTMKYLQESQRLAVLDEQIREHKLKIHQSKGELDELIQRTHLKLAKVRFEIRMRTRNINAVTISHHPGYSKDQLHQSKVGGAHCSSPEREADAQLHPKRNHPR